MFVLIVLYSFCITIIRCECPGNELLYNPCKCVFKLNDSNIYCGGDSDYDLSKVFEKLSKNLTENQKYFHKFYLNNTYINALKENTFKDITFDEIWIQNCSNLTSIHKNAFTTTQLITTELVIENNPKLYQSDDNSLFESISKFIALILLTLKNNNITHIPDNAFKPLNGYQNNLIYLHFSGLSIQSIGSRPFYYLKSLTYIDFANTSISYIPENALSIKETSKQLLRLDL